MHLVMRHLPAGFGAPPADLRAGIHSRIIRHAGAVLRAALADFRAGPAGVHVQVRSAKHEIRGGLADLGTVHHHAEVIGFGMRTALPQAVWNGFETCLMAIQADLDAAVHVIIERGVLGMGHDRLLWTSL
jgi:hypothetical protein